MWSNSRIIKKCGCGVIAAFDLYLYLQARMTNKPIHHINRMEYCKELEKIQRRYFPLLYPSGINGLMLTLGINRLFHDNQIPYRASWAASGEKLIPRIKSMLEQDIPVILSVGPNFPFFWQKHGICFYKTNQNGVFCPVTSISGHYVTVLSLDEEWMTITSWGQVYRIRLIEYKAYVKAHSNHLFSNIVLIKGTG